MLLRDFYDEKLAHVSYMVGCQASGEAIGIDPARNIDPYNRLDMAMFAAMSLLHLISMKETTQSPTTGDSGLFFG